MINDIKKLLDRCDSEKASKALLVEIRDIAWAVETKVSDSSKQIKKLWEVATDIRNDAKTVKAAQDDHRNLEFETARLKSAFDQLNKAYASVELALDIDRKNESRAAVEERGKAVQAKLAAEWDAHVGALADMLAAMKEVDAAITDHNVAFGDNMASVEFLNDFRPRQFGGNNAYAASPTLSLKHVDIQRINPANPLQSRPIPVSGGTRPAGAVRFHVDPETAANTYAAHRKTQAVRGTAKS